MSVVSVKSNVMKAKRDGGEYSCTELVYRDKGNVFTKYVATSFLEKNPNLKAQLSSLSAGDEAVLTVEKQGKFYNLVSIEKGAMTSETRTSKSRPAVVAKVSDDRQESIVFQNSMAHATAISLHNAKGSKVDVKKVISLAKMIARVAIKPDLSSAEEDTPSASDDEEEVTFFE